MILSTKNTNLIPIPTYLVESSAAGLLEGHRRQERRASAKRRRKEATREPRSVPLSGEPSHHEPQVDNIAFVSLRNKYFLYGQTYEIHR